MSSSILYPEVNALLEQVLLGVRTILQREFVGMYLYGSLATGDFDRASDIDFLVVTEQEISKAAVMKLRAMHAQIAADDSAWAMDIEGAYLSLAALRHYAAVPHLQLERGAGRTLEMANHFRVVERAVLRERGIVVAGPPIRNRIDPVSADDLRQSMREMLNEWEAPLLDEPAPFHNRGDQSYTVLSLCRALYTMEHGAVVSKPAAARWAQEALGERWVGLIERALVGRHHPNGQPDPNDVQGTLELARLTCGKSQTASVR
ncbi:MAG: DUF4111 domain-containing protein [Chloroflexota bacterium]|nr:MAG: DUF4111 domain-containing protein [Chloroflexota bacterium]